MDILYVPGFPGVPESFFEQMLNVPYDEKLREADPALEKSARKMELKVVRKLWEVVASSKADINVKKEAIAQFFSNKVDYLLPPKYPGPAGFEYTRHRIGSWKELLTCPLSIPDDDLSKLIRMTPKIPNQNHFAETGAGRLIFMVSWSFSLAQLHRLIEHLKQEETIFEESQTWLNFLISRKGGNRANDTPNAHITVRYIGSRAVSSDDPLPLTNTQLLHEEFGRNPFSGVLPEFLEAVNVALPSVANGVRVYILPDLFDSERNSEVVFWDNLTYQASLAVFDLKSLINRDVEPPLLPDDLPKDEFSLLETVYCGSKPPASVSGPSVHLQPEFKRLSQQMYKSSRPGNNQNTFPKAMSLEARRSLIQQAIPFPFEPEGERPLLTFAVKGIPPGDIYNDKQYLEGETVDALIMKILIGEAMLHGKKTGSYANVVPFYSFAPFFRRFGPGYVNEFTSYMWDYVRATRPVIFVTLGKRIAEVICKASRTDTAEGTESTPKQELKLGSPRIITSSGSAKSGKGPFSFIYIPLLDPGRYKYTTATETRKVFLSYMAYSFQYVVLVADTAKIFRDEMRSSGNKIDENSEEFCEEIILRVRRRLQSTPGRPFVEGIRKAKALIAELITQQPIMFS
ncbi:hypothetical protein F4813DRAFT_395588 [Daldinia decipiens]|uniref:uncharacterized protein n=1 Tax=Daldinia decipiens TaxID=326647 RepID=UPI0020C5978A|nr:uncharacterized protein F4813DRAFT_395588 [Daldinia decipiens]KAI1658698.1 hypothetical protein F4813DRAFT_395588 [Daldinia decipiens]